jgi:hypothetical protein
MSQCSVTSCFLPRLFTPALLAVAVWTATGPAGAAPLPVGTPLRCEARTPRIYPCTFTIEQIDSTSGRFTGRTEYPGLRAVLRTVGTLVGTRLQFEETEFIGPKGRADLNCVYDMQDKGDRYERPFQCAHPGTMVIYKGTDASPPPSPPASPPSGSPAEATPQPPKPAAPNPAPPPVTATTEGVWTLVGTEIEEQPNCFPEQPNCNTILDRKDGELFVTTTVYNKIDDRTDTAHFSFQWTPPPQTLTPRGILRLPASINRGTTRTVYAWAARLSVSFVRHGSNSGSAFVSLAVGVPPRDTLSFDSDEKGEWTVPRPMSDCLKETDGCRMDLRVGIRSTVHYARTVRYVYLYRAN